MDSKTQILALLHADPERLYDDTELCVALKVTDKGKEREKITEACREQLRNGQIRRFKHDGRMVNGARQSDWLALRRRDRKDEPAEEAIEKRAEAGISQQKAYELAVQHEKEIRAITDEVLRRLFETRQKLNLASLREGLDSDLEQFEKNGLNKAKREQMIQQLFADLSALNQNRELSVEEKVGAAQLLLIGLSAQGALVRYDGNSPGNFGRTIAGAVAYALK